MRIAFLGLDEVNRFLARKWTRKLAGKVRFIDVQQDSVPAGSVGVVADADSVPESYRRRWLALLAAEAGETPVLVFGHTLNDAEAGDLRRAGAKVVRRVIRRGTFNRWVERRTALLASVEP